MAYICWCAVELEERYTLAKFHCHYSFGRYTHTTHTQIQTHPCSYLFLCLFSAFVANIVPFSSGTSACVINNMWNETFTIHTRNAMLLFYISGFSVSYCRVFVFKKKHFDSFSSNVGNGKVFSRKGDLMTAFSTIFGLWTIAFFVLSWQQQAVGAFQYY